jgi:hypothetical protein
MREYIRHHFARLGTTVIDQWAYEWENHITPPHKYLGNFTRSEYLRFQLAGLRSKSILIMTHSFFYEFMKYWPSFSFATMLRDPVKRILSQFHFSKRTHAWEKNYAMNDWLNERTGFDYNLQTAALCGTPSLDINEMHLEKAKANLHFFDFIGFVDQYKLSINLFNKIYSVKGNDEFPWLNATQNTVAIPDSLTLALQERCKYDIELVGYAETLFKAKLAAWEMIASEDPEKGPSILTSS